MNIHKVCKKCFVAQRDKSRLAARNLGKVVSLVVVLPLRRLGFDPRSGHVGFIVYIAALGQVSSEYFLFPCR
jgi:hypothetical protein